ncbi:discoidin domain-containing protein [Micromonospora sp. M12]
MGALGAAAGRAGRRPCPAQGRHRVVVGQRLERPGPRRRRQPRTRWSSKFEDNQWIQVDLGAPVSFDQVTIVWEQAYARDFVIQVSEDGQRWTDVKSVSNAVTQLKISVNGVPVFARGGNWGWDELLRRVLPDRLADTVEMHRDMNFTMIRNWLGSSNREELYQACDEQGILVWNDFWQAGAFLPNPPGYVDIAADTIRRFRHHPSIVVWCGANEGDPPPIVDAGLKQPPPPSTRRSSTFPTPPAASSAATARTTGWSRRRTTTGTPTTPARSASTPRSACRWCRWWRACATSSATRRSGRSVRCGTTTTGRPSVTSGSARTRRRSTHGSASPTRSTSSPPGRSSSTTRATAPCSRPGTPTCGRTPPVCCCGCRTRRGTAPSGRPTTTTSTSTAPTTAPARCEPVHVQADPGTWQVRVVNHTGAALHGVTVTARRYDLNGRSLGSPQRQRVDVARSATTPAFALATPNADGLHLVRLELRDNRDRLLTQNTYWRYDRAEQMRALNDVPSTRLSTSSSTVRVVDGRNTVTTTVRNQGRTVAAMVRLAVRDQRGERVLPARYDDNYFWLLPGRHVRCGSPGRRGRAWPARSR